MRTVSVFKNGNNQAVRLPKDMEFDNVSELEIVKIGDVVTLRPIRPSWQSLTTLPQADADFLQDRPSIVNNEGRFEQ
jgi:antitoxin VapB